jgi:hypothetical protein
MMVFQNIFWALPGGGFCGISGGYSAISGGYSAISGGYCGGAGDGYTPNIAKY